MYLYNHVLEKSKFESTKKCGNRISYMTSIDPDCYTIVYNVFNFMFIQTSMALELCKQKGIYRF